MVTDSFQAYEERAVSLALSITPSQFGRSNAFRHGELEELRHNLFMNRENMPLFDCERWTKNLEKGMSIVIRGGMALILQRLQGSVETMGEGRNNNAF